jgi:F0F1-type ATP synthase delta subunit
MTHYTNKFKNTQDERTKVIVTARQDPSIVGGVIYDINGKVTDLSWKHQHELAMAKLAEYNGL